MNIQNPGLSHKVALVGLNELGARRLTLKTFSLKNDEDKT